MDISGDIAVFTGRAERAYTAMRKAKGQIASFCHDDARFYLGRAIEIAEAAGRTDMVARLELRRTQIVGAFDKQQDRIASQQQRTGIECWENEGGAIGA